MTKHLTEPTVLAPEAISTAELSIETTGEGFYDITAEARRFLTGSGARDGVLLLFVRHTSASLTIQENADPEVQADLTAALRRLAPEDADWAHTTEGPDDMPAHVKTMLSGVSLHVPVVNGGPGLGTWQGIYLVEHRAQPHRRSITLQFLGSRG